MARAGFSHGPPLRKPERQRTTTFFTDRLAQLLLYHLHLSALRAASQHPEHRCKQCEWIYHVTLLPPCAGSMEPSNDLAGNYTVSGAEAGGASPERSVAEKNGRACIWLRDSGR